MRAAHIYKTTTVLCAEKAIMQAGRPCLQREREMGSVWKAAECKEHAENKVFPAQVLRSLSPVRVQTVDLRKI